MMKPCITPASLAVICGIAALDLRAQTDVNTSNPPPGSQTNPYTCGDPNNTPTKGCKSCGDSEESSASDPSASSQDTGPDTADEPEGNTCPVDSPNNEINTNTGGVETKTTDISLPGATGDMPLAFSRFYQTRDTTANGDLMGHGRTFTHSHSWSMWASGSGGNSRSILMPGGNTLNFAPYPGTTTFEGQTAIRYIPETGFGERVYQVGDWYYLLIPGGERYAFERVTDSGGFTRYFPRNRRDTKGNLHTYTTDASARITRVTDAAGNWIEMTYAGVPFDKKENVVIATLTSAPVVGWNEISVTTSQPFQWVQGISAPNLTFSMAELEFYAPAANGGAPVKLSGTPYGNGPASSNSTHTFDKLFDNNTSTGFSFIRTGMGIAGLDLGEGKASHVTKIRFFISSYNANRLNSYIGHQFVGRVSTPQIVTALTRVTTSAGEIVDYHYDTYTDPSIHQEHLVLSKIDYVKDRNGDQVDDITADAEITWTTSLQGYAPHIERMIEPRRKGSTPELSFEYLPISIAPAKGMPFRVRGGPGDEGNAIYTIENRKTRQYRFANGGSHTISNSASNFLPHTSTDAAGKVTTYTWTSDRHFLASRTTAAGTTHYTHNYMGQPLTIQHPDGLTETRTYDVQGRLLTRSYSASGYTTRTTTYTRNAQGRITKITYPDGSFEEFNYNSLGLLESVREKNGSFTVHTYDLTPGSPTAGLRLSTSRGLATASASGGETETFTWTGLNEPNGVPARLLRSSTDARGRTTTYDYDPQGRLTLTTYPDASFTEVEYDDFGNKIAQFDGVSIEEWTYDSFRRPLTHVDAAGGITTYDYGINGAACSCYGAGAPTLITSPQGRKTRRFYDLKGRLTSEIRGFLTPEAATTTYNYDILGRRISSTDPDGFVTQFTHDAMGRTLTTTQDFGGLNLVSSQTYSPFGETLTSTLPGNRTTTTTYDVMGRPVTITDPLSTVTKINYDSAGRRSSVIEAFGINSMARTTSFTYDVHNRLTSTNYPGGTSSTQTYHPGGEIHTRTDESGLVTVSNTSIEPWEDSLGNKWNTFAQTTTIDPNGANLTSISYGPPMSYTGGTRRSVSAAGRISESYTDELGRTTLTRSGMVAPGSELADELSEDPGVDLNADLTETTMSYDADGFMLSSTVDPGGLNLTTTYQPDGLGRVQTVIDPMGRATRFAYDKRGNRTHTTIDYHPTGGSGLNLTTVNDYDALGRLHSTTDPKNQTLTYSYWNETSLTLTLEDARNNVTSWTYNNRGQILSKLYPNGDDHAYSYDTLGRMWTHTTPNNHICTYSYDSRDRLTLSQWNPTAPDTQRGYWPGGQIKFIDNGISRSDYLYNSRNLLISETQTISGQSPRTVSYDYDADGLRTNLDYPSGVAIENQWTALGQLDTVSADGPPPLASYSYDKAGRLIEAEHENGITQDRGYDAASQLLNITHTHNGVIQSGHSYQYDKAGRRTSESFLVGSTPARTYSYDAASQVTAADYGAGQTDSFNYDAMGNRTSATIASQGGGTFNYGAATKANQYTSITGRSAITHDANGNQLLNGAGAAFTWDSENRLLTVTPVSPNLGDKAHVHSYDGLHRRVTRTTREWTSSGWTNLETTYFIYDGWNVIEEWTSTFSPATTATLTRRLTWGQDLAGSPSLQGAGGVGGLLMVEEITSTTNEAYHFHYDGNGNVTEITDHLGASVATYRYDAFGNTLVAAGTYAATNRYRFSTKPLDHEVITAPLYYYGYRYLDPVTGRWPSRDPIEERGGVNLYGFVGNDTARRWDRLGLEAECSEGDRKAVTSSKLATFNSKGTVAGDLIEINESISASLSDLGKIVNLGNLAKAGVEGAQAALQEALNQLADEKVPDHGDFVSQANETAMSALTEIDGTQGNGETTWFFRGGMIVVHVRCCACECIKPFWSLGLGEGEWKWICGEPREFVYVPHRWNGLYSLTDWNAGQGAMGRTQMDGFPKAVNNITMGDVAEAIRLAEEAANCKGGDQ